MAIFRVFKDSAGAIRDQHFKEPIVPEGDAAQIIREPDIRLNSPAYPLGEFGFLLLTELPSKGSKLVDALAGSVVVLLIVLLTDLDSEESVALRLDGLAVRW